MKPDLLQIANSVEVISDRAFALHGVEHKKDDPEGTSAPRTSANLPMRLERTLYLLYCRQSQPPETARALSSMREHIAALSAANNGRGTWEPGWTLVSTEKNGRLVVRRDTVHFWTSRRAVRMSSLRSAACRVRIEKEIQYYATGFYFAIGNENEPDSGGRVRPILRVYWNLTPKSALTYMRLVTRLMNKRKIPFRTKVVAHPGGYLRSDSGVLYLQRRYFPKARGVLREIHGAIGNDLRAETPMFTKTCARGLAFADDPGTHLSFGQSRCRTIARALLESFLAGEHSARRRLARMQATFRSAGIDPTRLYLNPGSRDIFELPGGA